MKTSERDELIFQILCRMETEDFPIQEIGPGVECRILDVYRQLIEADFLSGDSLTGQDGVTTVCVHRVQITDRGRVALDLLRKERAGKTLGGTTWRVLKFILVYVWPIASAVIIAYLLHLLKLKPIR